MAEPKPLPLSGVRVLDVATFIAAPYAATILGEFGAEVIKVERPDGGDPFRYFGTPTGLADSSLAWLSESRNKKSVTLDLRKPEGRDLFLRLAGKSDVICENFRPGTLEKWGLGPDVLLKENPGLVILRITGYGQTGPYKDRPGFARVAHAVGGLTYLSGLPGETPVTPGSTSLGDYTSGLHGAIGVLVALRHRDATGNGQVIDLGLYESIFRVLDETAPAYAFKGIVREPEGTGTRNACPHGHFPTGDGKWVAIACTTDKMFERLCQAMGAAGGDLLERYAAQEKRLAARHEVNDRVARWTGALARDKLMEICLAHEVPAGPINSIADIFADPQFQARGDLARLNVAGVGEVTVPAVFPKLSETPGEIRSLGPRLGEHNGDVYGRLLGVGAVDMEKLKKAGVI
jgi:succinyl-CoA:(S)-malate CoA-transferase subunit A/succinyl-CoA:(S)-malate CoA-transferase subunit B